MENALLVGLSRQIGLHRELEVVANNIANVNTTGYKADQTIFHEFLMPGASHGHFRGEDRRLSYVHDRATWHDFRPGALQQTGNPLDLAIDGDAFFVVQTPQGERYTRNGALQINAAGQLVTSEGYQLQSDSGQIQFQNNDSRISIAEDGTIRVREGADARTDALRGRLRIVRFDQNQRLQKEGSGLFSAPADLLPQPPPTPQPPQSPQRVRVMQGYLEQSNVRAVVEMSRMVEITRAYTLMAGMLQQYVDMRQNAVDKLAEVPA
jgi:flagellar basal-body rod protein FlgF/flagellar basal-body rod protein FlgG